MSESRTPWTLHIQIINEKHGELPKIMIKEGIDCWIIFVRETSTTPDSSMQFVVGGDVVLSSAFIFALQADNSLRKIALVANFDANAEREKGIWDQVIGYEKGITSDLQSIMTEISPQNIGLNYSTQNYASDGLTHGMFLKLNELLPSYSSKFCSAQEIVNAIRSKKTITEINLIQKACEITIEINESITKKLKIGQNESEIQKMFHEEVGKRGLGFSWQQVGNPAIDVSPKEFGHALPKSTNIIKEGDTLHNDFGVLYKGYASDLQRMWFFGKKQSVPEELRHGLDTIVKGIQLAADNI